MSIVTATPKGQIVIPAPIRAKFGITGGSRVEVREEEGKIVVVPLLADPVRQARGIFKGGDSALKALAELRREEAGR
jgi:AbrB family looped-hinge helix DNA binding protein